MDPPKRCVRPTGPAKAAAKCHFKKSMYLFSNSILFPALPIFLSVALSLSPSPVASLFPSLSRRRSARLSTEFLHAFCSLLAAFQQPFYSLCTASRQLVHSLSTAFLQPGYSLSTAFLQPGYSLLAAFLQPFCMLGAAFLQPWWSLGTAFLQPFCSLGAAFLHFRGSGASLCAL